MIAALDHVAVRRHGHTDLAPLSLRLQPGTLTAVLGGDGAGKTTLLRLLVGAIAPAEGTVRRPARPRIGYSQAGVGIYVDLTVEENLRFVASAYGLRGKGVVAARIATLLDSTGLGGARNRLGGRLSGGMQRKLAFACAVLHEPDLLVMDEPTTGLDPVSRAELWRLVAHALAADTATVFSTTYVDEGSRADHVVVLDRGRVLASGSPAQLCATVPGTVVRLPGGPVEGVASWRRGRLRHAWIPAGAPPAGAERLQPDLEDAVIVAALDAAGNAP